MAENLTTQFTDSTSSDATQSVYNTLLLVRSTYPLIHQVPVRKYSLKQRTGKTMIFRRFEALAKAKTPLNEGTPPAGKKKTKTDVSMTIKPYGDFIEDSDMVLNTQPDPQALERTSSCSGSKPVRRSTSLYRDMWADATNIVYASGTSRPLSTRSLIVRSWIGRSVRPASTRCSRSAPPSLHRSGLGLRASCRPTGAWLTSGATSTFDTSKGFVLPVDYANGSATLVGEGGSDKNGVRYLISRTGISCRARMV